MPNRRQFTQSLTSIALAGMTPFLGAQTEKADKSDKSDKIVLGQSLSLTGMTAPLAVAYTGGARLAFDQANAAGGIGGRQIELRVLDDGYDPERSVANTRKFLEDDVFALFGYFGTAPALAAMPLAVRSKTPFFAPYSGSMTLRSPFNRHVFHVRASANEEIAVMVKQLTNLGLNRIGVFYQNDPYGQSGLDGVNIALSTLNLLPQVTASVERNTVAVDAAVNAISSAAPVAVIQICTFKQSAAFIRGARKAGFGGLFYNVSAVGAQTLAEELGNMAAGVVVSQVMPSPFTPAQTISREFIEMIRHSGSTVRANYNSIEGFVAARVLIDGMRRSGGRLSRDSLINGLETMSDASVGGFKVSYSRVDHVASTFVEMSVLLADGRVRT